VGRPTGPTTYALAERFFLRVIGLIYLGAFGSLSIQVLGLIGSRGLLPAATYLAESRVEWGSAAYWQVPTLFWLNSSDAALVGACLAGMLLAMLVVGGVAQRLALVGVFVLYLSLVAAGQDFLGFQWDSLLLEAGFLAIFLGLSPIVIWLFRWLLFRLVFMSGVVKLTSGDPTWHTLTALNYHYETQPLPTVFGWFAYHLPEAFQRLSVLATFGIELGAPFLIFAPRRLRHGAAGAIILLQSLIFLTGNYAYFNLLTVALCLFLFDDATLRNVTPARLRIWVDERLALRQPIGDRRTAVGRIMAGLAAIPIGLLSLAYMLNLFSLPLPPPILPALEFVAPLRIANPYGLFAVMTTTRREIIVEGSNDGQTWLPYEFKYKPGDVRQAPRWVQPHQPRLDWQMWFAALGPSDQSPWFSNLMLSLLNGSTPVLQLLANNPFPAAPPRFVRALIYQYHFTDLNTLRSDGTWWRRDLLGVYFPPVSLNH
jgi:hypothetical protein